MYKMKKLYFILSFQILFLAAVLGQFIPKGMNYQAVARDKSGNLMSNQNISLKIFLFSVDNQTRANHFSELHHLKTNELGLFNLVIGEGEENQGEYGLVPWNLKNIWLEVDLIERGTNRFSAISNSKLLAVPYAIHAGTATRLTEKTTGRDVESLKVDPGVRSNFWSVFGNAKSNESGNLYHPNALGTTDMVDLIMITDNVERLRILSGGDIITKLNFAIGKNLNVGDNATITLNATICDSLIVKKNVLFNSSGGSTINYGPFIVAKMSPSLLSGKLTVDLATDLNSNLTVHGPTDLNDSLLVNNMSPTKLTGSLQVDLITNLNDSLFVNNMAPVFLSGTLNVDSMATFDDRVKILSQHSTDTSGLTPTGSLQVGGGAYIAENLYVGGVAKFGGPVAFGGAVSITDLTQSISPSTGALKVSGGVGIGLNLNVGGAAMLGGMVTIKDLTESLDPTSGALKILGGVGIAKRLNVGGSAYFGNTFNVAGATTMNDSFGVTSTQNYVATFINQSAQNGIAIKIGNSSPGLANNYLEFRNNAGGVVGRIEGENGTEYTNNPSYLVEIGKLNSAILSSEIAWAISIVTLVIAAAQIIARVAAFTTCVGLGAMACIPVISMIVKAGVDFAAAEVQEIAAGGAVDQANNAKNAYTTYKMNHIGVTYESGAGDYAEWLPKADTNEVFLPGQIVSVKKGFIQKELNSSDKLLVISSKPIVLGNAPDHSEHGKYERVAFLGQIPVHVIGKVNVGDYILPSGDNDGFGRAKAPGDMEVEDYLDIVGIAWSASSNDTYNLINVAIGLNTTDINQVILKQRKKIEDLMLDFDKRNAILANLVPGYKNAAAKKINNPEPAMSLNNSISNPPASTNVQPNPYSVSNDQLKQLLDNAEKILSEKGIDTGDNAFWNKLKSDPVYKDQFIEQLQEKIKKDIPKQLEKLIPKAND